MLLPSYLISAPVAAGLRLLGDSDPLLVLVPAVSLAEESDADCSNNVRHSRSIRRRKHQKTQYNIKINITEGGV